MPVSDLVFLILEAIIIKRTLRWVLIFISVGFLIFLYKKYNPIGNNYFPKCPFKELTGYQCPGCGSQRAIHYLLNFQLIAAFKENMLLVLSIPYLLLGFIFNQIKNPSEKILKYRKRLFGPKAIYIILVIVTAFWILRNISF
ncbi:DUF2752 domain-containing protein [Arachidicoccus sp.]|uniref:DUF2752 domain-containing protein n=1 Tax=Arachidicoccus sp. TaxID=1872624 RepID=UPI003D25CD0A